jgi:hypothetical protein
METVLRYVSDQKLAPAQEESGNLHGGGFADVITPVIHETQREVWSAMRANTPRGEIAWENPLLPYIEFGPVNHRDWYGVAVMDHVVDFVLAVRGLRESEFTADDALMSEMMEVGAHESALQEGRRIELPLEGDLEADAHTREKQKEQYGVDPLDVEAMLDVSFPRP